MEVIDKDSMHIPDEIWMTIFNFLDPITCSFTLTTVSKRIRKIVLLETFWNMMTQSHFSRNHDITSIQENIKNDCKPDAYEKNFWRITYFRIFDSTSEKRFKELVRKKCLDILKDQERTDNTVMFIESGEYQSWVCGSNNDSEVVGWGDYEITFYHYRKKTKKTVSYGSENTRMNKRKKKRKKKKKKEVNLILKDEESENKKIREAKREFNSKWNRICDSFKGKRSRSSKKNKRKKINRLIDQMKQKYSSLVSKQNGLTLTFDGKCGGIDLRSQSNEQVVNEVVVAEEMRKKPSSPITNTSFADFVGKCAVRAFVWSCYDKPEDILDHIQFVPTTTTTISTTSGMKSYFGKRKKGLPSSWEDILDNLGEGLTKKHLRGVGKNSKPVNIAYLMRTGNEVMICVEGNNGFHKLVMLTS